MFLLNKNKDNKKAFTLIEIMVVLFIFSVIVVTFYKTFTVGMKLISESKNRTGAVALANEKMEIVRNLKYEDIGISGGIPNGKIAQDEDLTVNGRKYHVKSFVQFMDDPFDGVAPVDTIPNDYKRVKITVSWNDGMGGTKSVFFVSRFVPPGLETSSGDGVFAINVFDSSSNAVSQANLHLVNSAVSPNVNFSVSTDNDGHLLEPGALASVQKYQITVSKSGYETFNTLDPNPLITGFTPKPEFCHASVISGALNTYNYVIDKLSSLKIVTVDPQGNALPNVNFDIKGGKILGTNSDTTPHYNLNLSAQTTNASGEKELNNISPGGYIIDPSLTGHTFVGFVSGVKMYSLAAGSSDELKIKMANNSVDSLFVKVVDDASGQPVEGATVTLKKTGDPDIVLTTLADGAAFFPSDSNPLGSGSYQLDVVASGYADKSDTVSVNALTTSEVRMTLN